MPEEITCEIPKKLSDFIDDLIKQGYFNSRSDFARCSMEIIAQLYGLSGTTDSGKALLDFISSNKKGAAPKIEAKTIKQSKSTTSSSALTAEEYDLLDMFAGLTFENEDALHARFTMELMKLAKAPLPKDDFINLLESLAAKEKIVKTTHNGKTVWKVLERE